MCKPEQALFGRVINVSLTTKNATMVLCFREYARISLTSTSRAEETAFEPEPDFKFKRCMEPRRSACSSTYESLVLFCFDRTWMLLFIDL